MDFSQVLLRKEYIRRPFSVLLTFNSDQDSTFIKTLFIFKNSSISRPSRIHQDAHPGSSQRRRLLSLQGYSHPQGFKTQDQDSSLPIFKHSTSTTRTTLSSENYPHSSTAMANPLANRTKCNIGKKTVYVPNTTSTTTLGEILAALALRGHSEAVQLHEGTLDSGVRVETMDFFPSCSTLNLQPPLPSAQDNQFVLELMKIDEGISLSLVVFIM